jgi:spore germination protein YaaH
VEKALLKIPAQKLILGISKQANQWITSNEITTRYSPDIAEVEKRLISPGSLVTWSLPYYLKRITFQDPRGSHDIYYEDSAAIEKKLWLAKFYGLKGVSLWYMGNFTSADWDVIQNR